MKLANYIVVLISAIISYIFVVINSNNISNIKIKIDFKNFLIIIFISLLSLLNYIYNKMLPRSIISMLLFIIIIKLLQRKSTYENTFTGLLIYIVAMLVEFIFSYVLTIFVSKYNFEITFIYSCIFTLIQLLLTYLIFKIKCVRKLCDLFLKLNLNNNFKIISLTAMIIIIVTITNKYYIEYANYIIYFVLLIFFIIIILILIINKVKNLKMKKEKNTLMEVLNKYENISDENRIVKHETLNNFIILKSIQDRNSDKYNDALNHFIEEYSAVKSGYYRNMSNMPSGIKGIIYYKLNNIEKLNMLVNVSKSLNFNIKKLSSIDYLILCRILSISLDNAIEASLESEDKILNIDVYEMNKNVVIEITNSYKNNVDLESISKKNYSTKGNNRGFGLYIVNKMLKKTNNIILEQNINNKLFTSKIFIKK